MFTGEDLPINASEEPGILQSVCAPAESQAWTGLALACGEDTKRLSHHKTAVSSTPSEPAASRSPVSSYGVATLEKAVDLEPGGVPKGYSLRLEMNRRDPTVTVSQSARFPAYSGHRSASGGKAVFYSPNVGAWGSTAKAAITAAAALTSGPS